jgi:hypothetical protein
LSRSSFIAWPLVNRFVVRRFRKPAHAVHGGHAHPLVELAEELAADGENLSEQESVLARAERREGAGGSVRGAPGESRGPDPDRDPDRDRRPS